MSVNWSEAEIERKMENKISKFKSFVEEDYKLSLDKY
jgi:hypothetical protein